MNTSFSHSKALDNEQTCSTYGEKGLYKLSLNGIADGDYQSLDNWLRMVEQYIISDTMKKDNQNRYADFRKLPFAWRVSPFNAHPENDPSLGIPADLEAFSVLQREGEYVDTKISHIRIELSPVEAKDQTPAYTKITVTTTNSVGVEQAKAELTSYFGGLSHKEVGLSFPKFMEVTNTVKIRFSLTNFISHILSCLPDTIALQFKRGAIPNWSAVRELLFSYKKCLRPQPDMLRLRAILQFCSSPKMKQIKLRSKVTALRELLIPFFNKYEAKVDLKEAHGELVGFKGQEAYSPIINLLIQFIGLLNEDQRSMEDVWETIARKLEKKPGELSVMDILGEKELLYQKFDLKNKANKELDLRVFNRAAQNVKLGIEDEYTRILTANSKKDTNTNSVKINHVDDESEPEDVYEDEEGFYYQRIPKRNFRRKPIKFSSGLGRGGRAGRGNTRMQRSNHPFGDGKWNSQKAPDNGRNFPARRGRGNWRGKFRTLRQNGPKRFKTPDGFRWIHADDYDNLYRITDDAFDDDDEVTQLDDMVECDVAYDDDVEAQTGEDSDYESETNNDVMFFRSLATEDINDTECLNFSELFDKSRINYSVLRSGIHVNCKFGNKQVKVKTILDSGATRSLVNENFLKNFNAKRIVKSQATAKIAKAAGGKTIKLAPYRASFTLPFKNFRLKFVDAVVTQEGPSDLILLGLSDLVRNDFDLSCRGNKVVYCRLHNFDLTADEHIELDDDSDIFGLRVEVPPDNSKVSLKINDGVIEKPLKKLNSSDSLCNLPGEAVKTESELKKNPDGEKAFWTEIERIRQELLNINTMSDVKIDPDDEFSDPVYRDFKKQILDILDDNKILFRGECGHVRDERYIVRGEIKGTLLGKSVPNYYAKMPDQVKSDLVDKLNKEIANGILKRLPKGVSPMHVLPIFSVGKRGDDGHIQLNTNCIRLVMDCSHSINLATQFSATQSDNIKSIIQKVAKYTKHGRICTLDISQMFFSFEIERKLQKYFCVEHPTCGIFAYTRLPMGWICSVSSSREFLMRMLYKHEKYTTRYLDDLCIFGDTDEEFLENLDAVLKTLKYFGFRLKGKKMRILGTEIDLLGKRIVKGKILPSKHCIENIDSIVQEKIVTKRQLKSFIGMVSYISDHIPFQSDLLNELRNATKGELASSVEWTSALIKNFENVRSVTNKLLTLYPVLPERPIHCVVDSSILATGAFFYQTTEEEPNVKRFIKIFSRRRSDFDNKHAISSCQCELNGILAAMTAASTEIEVCKEKVFIHTDSKSVADIYKRLRNMEVPSADKRINTAFAKLMVFNYEINYISNKELPILAADYISRNEDTSMNCDGCTICKSVAMDPNEFCNNIEVICRAASEIRYCNELTPSVSVDQFLALQESVSMNVPFSTYPYGINCNGFFDSLLTNPDDLEQLRRFDVDAAYIVGKKRNNYDPNLCLQEILGNRRLMVDWQNESKDFRKAKELLVNGMAATKKLNTVQTLLEKKQCFLEDGLLMVKKFDSVREIKCIMMPESKTAQICEAAHVTLGHSAMYRFIKEIKRRFHVPNVIPYIRSMTGDCQDCTFLKHNPKIFRPMKDFEEEIPETIGSHILIDEITRTKRIFVPAGTITRANKIEHSPVWKFVFATCILSRYSILVPIQGKGPLTSDVLRNILIDLKFKYSANQNIEMTMLMDGCSIHAALCDDEVLKNHKIKINIRPRTSGSKNYLAMLDSRIAKVSVLLNQEMQADSIPKYAAARNAIARYNSTPGGEGVSPWETYHNRDAVTGKTINIDISKLTAVAKHLRASSRLSKEKGQKRTRFRTPFKFVAFEDGMKYSDPDKMPIKIGDRILIDKGGFNKNETSPWYQVHSFEDIPSGVDFEKKLVSTIKVGMKNKPRVYIWQLDWISQICNGNGKIATDDRGYWFSVYEPDGGDDQFLSLEHYVESKNRTPNILPASCEQNDIDSEEMLHWEPVSYYSDSD